MLWVCVALCLFLCRLDRRVGSKGVGGALQLVVGRVSQIGLESGKPVTQTCASHVWGSYAVHGKIVLNSVHCMRYGLVKLHGRFHLHQ